MINCIVYLRLIYEYFTNVIIIININNNSTKLTVLMCCVFNIGILLKAEINTNMHAKGQN